uniref:Uncharacterized protein n=1 Tax=viral metagenome TaxID=1070528 RepID=A0A6C0D7W0_9ZZZZ
MDILQTVKVGSGSILVVSLIALVIFIILVIYHYNVKPIIPFLTSNQTQYQTLPTYEVQTLHANRPVSNDTALDFSSIANFNSNKFTLSFDVFLSNTYKSTVVPRVLLYFSTIPVNITSNTFKEFKEDSIKIPRIMDSTQTDILTIFDSTNIIVYMDPVKNDLKVGVVTNVGVTKYLELLPTINNVPINKTFQITIIKSDKFIEVYKNKLLITTYKMKNNVVIVPTTSKLYSPINFIGDTIKIGNIQYFNNVITSSQVRSITNDLKNNTFFTTS